MNQNQPVAAPAILPPIEDPTVHAEVDRLAHRYIQAGGVGMDVLAAIGGKAEALIERLPAQVRRRIDRVTYRGLVRALGAAARSRRLVGQRGDGFNRLLSTASGAAGGLAGLPGAVIELPLTITLLLRAILEVGAEHGFDPESDLARTEALRVLASAGPLAEDDGTDLGLLAARLSITGQTIQGLISKVAPKLSISLAQKLGAQALPVLGAVAGGSINYAFAAYYQDLARVNFGILRMAQETGLPREALNEAFELRVAEIRASSSGWRMQGRKPV